MRNRMSGGVRGRRRKPPPTRSESLTENSRVNRLSYKKETKGELKWAIVFLAQKRSNRKVN